MITVGQLLHHLESIAPLAGQENYDNSGLLVGDENQSVTKVLVSLDVTMEVLEEAVAQGCEVILSHHPVIFRGLKRLTGKHFVERIVMEAIRRGINLVAMHTNLDNVLENGVNSRVADRLQLLNTTFLAPSAKGTAPGVSLGAGLIGYLSTPLSAMDFLSMVKVMMQAKVIRHTQPPDQLISKVAICGGSGSFLLSSAQTQGAHALVTADFKYHDFFEADGKILVVDLGHYESEQYTIELLRDILVKKFTDLTVITTSNNTNPVRYLV